MFNTIYSDGQEFYKLYYLKKKKKKNLQTYITIISPRKNQIYIYYMLSCSNINYIHYYMQVLISLIGKVSKG